MGNALAMVTGAIAAGLYGPLYPQSSLNSSHSLRYFKGNIGFKIFYINIIEGLFGGPPFMSFKGRIIWAVLIPICTCSTGHFYLFIYKLTIARRLGDCVCDRNRRTGDR